jgi:hypothetical protein
VPGPLSIQSEDGKRTLDLLNSAPTADTGQVAVPVRVISQLGAGTGGGGATGGLTDAELRASPVPMRQSDGTLALSLLDAAPASDTGQVAIPVRVVSQLGAGTGGGSSAGLTDAELRASPVPVSGFPTTQPVSGTVNVGNFPATQPVSGTVAVSNLPATQPVSGTFWPATQPVSGTVSVSNFPASQPVTGTFWQATQPVSGTVAISGPVLEQPANSAVSVTGAAAAAVTATLPAAGAGLFHYISRINIIAYATVARTGAATPVVVTSTNLPGGLAWTTPTAAAIGTQYETDIQLTSPLKSSAANVATTIVAPATASVIWRINVIYYTGP